MLLPDLPRDHKWSEAYRLECEARMVAALPRPHRLEYYERIAKRRGHNAAQALVNAVNELRR